MNLYEYSSVCSSNADTCLLDSVLVSVQLLYLLFTDINYLSGKKTSIRCSTVFACFSQMNIDRFISINNVKDVVHSCPNCDNFIGRYNRGSDQRRYGHVYYSWMRFSSLTCNPVLVGIWMSSTPRRSWMGKTGLVWTNEFRQKIFSCDLCSTSSVSDVIPSRFLPFRLPRVNWLFNPFNTC